ncbi:hypothetical protein TGGT1_217726 [Toxoplasma gondii GT1]|uniref:Uncharacterized protein n=1 Tax=Toxoplasma gondii (strain ATCC 50853 / GT1) TaxID=507601 RepID=S7WHN9_TOXGG|nr:hypothetical protein TGGT1_217726 [Toxoplasma gondii GT1]
MGRVKSSEVMLKCKCFEVFFLRFLQFLSTWVSLPHSFSSQGVRVDGCRGGRARLLAMRTKPDTPFAYFPLLCLSEKAGDLKRMHLNCMDRPGLRQSATDERKSNACSDAIFAIRKSERRETESR